MKKLLLGLLAITLSGHVHAGMPIPDEVTCPLGGKTFEVTSTISCSTMGIMMNLQSVTSCDFVTRLPQCPDNKLPIYKDFSDEEITRLPEILELKSVKSSSSKYYKSYLIEQALPEPDPILSFLMLQNGTWYEPRKLTLDDPDYMASYETAFALAMSDEKMESKEFWSAGRAMIFIDKGELETASKIIEELDKSNDGENEYFTEYLEALQYCLKNSDDKDLCSLQSFLRDHTSDEE